MFGFGKSRLFSDISRQLIEHFEDGVVVVDGDRNVILYNEGAAHIFGYAAEEVIGRPVGMLLPERFRARHEEMISAFEKSEALSTHSNDRGRQLAGMRKDGSEFVASVSIVKVGHGAMAAVIRDISEDKKTEDELIRLASTDALTGAFNRREFTMLADQEAQRAARYNHPLSILMLDLDHFKEINDTHGHGAGDKALQRFTTLCVNTLRNVDIFGRWGGEEFVALLPETSADAAATIAERLRKIVSQSVTVYEDKKISFTVSIGIAQYRMGEVTVEAPLSRADAALYQAKNSGRNQIIVVKNE